jgi:hypothetical protein
MLFANRDFVFPEWLGWMRNLSNVFPRPLPRLFFPKVFFGRLELLPVVIIVFLVWRLHNLQQENFLEYEVFSVNLEFIIENLTPIGSEIAELAACDGEAL